MLVTPLDLPLLADLVAFESAFVDEAPFADEAAFAFDDD